MKRRKKRQKRQEQQGEDGEALLQRGRGRRSGEVDSGGDSAGRGGDDSSRPLGQLFFDIIIDTIN